MDSMHDFKDKLEKLDSLLGQLKSSHGRVRQLKRSVHVLRVLLSHHEDIKSPYGPATPIARFSLQ